MEQIKRKLYINYTYYIYIYKRNFDDAILIYKNLFVIVYYFILVIVKFDFDFIDSHKIKFCPLNYITFY